MIRVLHLVKTSTGATWALRQMRELVKLGLDVHVALPADGPLVPKYKQYGIKVHDLQTDFPSRRLWDLPQRCRSLRALVSAINPDIIHSHFVGTTLMLRLALGKSHPTPRIFQVPGPLHLEHRFSRRIELATAGRSDYWVGSCHWTTERYRHEGISSNRVFLSYYGTDLDIYKRTTSGKLRDELGIENSIKIIGMVAYMYAPKRFLGQKRGIKGHEDLVDAIAICSRTRKDIVGVFIGGAWNGAYAYERNVRNYALHRCADHCIFLGTRDDVPALYPDLDVAVHPSHSENLGGAVESLLLNVPTIATDVGGFPDVIIDGKTGWLVPPRHPEELAQKILYLLDNRETALQIANAGQQHVERLCDVRTTAKEISAIYEQILHPS